MNLPINTKNTRAALLTLAVVKNFKTYFDRAEKNAKAYLAQAIDEGATVKAVSDDGDELATVTRTREGEATWTVSDPEAFVAWCTKRGIDHGGIQTWEFPKEATSHDTIASYIAEHDEIPAGLTSKPGRVSTITVKQSAAQADAVMALYPGSELILKALKN